MSEHVVATKDTCPYKASKMHENNECRVCDQGLDICLKCGKAEGELFGACIPVTTPTPDTVAQARAKYDRAVASLDAIRGIEFDVAAEEKAVEDAWAEVLAAVTQEVEARCAAKYETALTAVSESGGVGRVIVERVRRYVLEAQP